jgi:hypothetical protein
VRCAGGTGSKANLTGPTCIVHPEYLSKAFAEAREASGLYGDMEPAKRPTFHEIRGSGGADLPGRGNPRCGDTGPLTHAHRRTTQIYLDKGPTATDR